MGLPERPTDDVSFKAHAIAIPPPPKPASRSGAPRLGRGELAKDRPILILSSSRQIRLVDAQSGEIKVWQKSRNKGEVLKSAISADGAVFAVKDGQEVKLFDLATFQRKGTALAVKESRDSASESSLFLSDDGAWVVTAGENPALGWVVCVWDCANGNMIAGPFPYIYGARQGFSLDTSDIVLSHDKSKLVIFDGSLGNAVVWDLGVIDSLPIRAPEWLPEFALVSAGLRFDVHGSLRPLSLDDWSRVTHLEHSGNDAWQELARWLTQKSEMRAVAPSVKQTFFERAKDEITQSTEHGYMAAAADAPELPLLHLAEAGFGYNEDGRRRLRRLALRQLGNDATLWAEASSLLENQSDTAGALEAARRGVEIDQNSVAAVRSLAEALRDTKQVDEALAVYTRLLALPNAEARDIGSPPPMHWRATAKVQPRSSSRRAG